MITHCSWNSLSSTQTCPNVFDDWRIIAYVILTIIRVVIKTLGNILLISYCSYAHDPGSYNYHSPLLMFLPVSTMWYLWNEG